MNDLEQWVIENVDRGIKATELACDFQVWTLDRIGRSAEPTYDVEDLFRICAELVGRREIIEIEYVLPSMEYRTKSFYLPKHVKIKISDWETCREAGDPTYNL